jgi:hypothetical protein
MKATAWLVTQWGNGSAGEMTVLGVVIAANIDQARMVLPEKLAFPIGNGPGQHGPIELEDLGEIELAQALPVFLKYHF